MDQIDLIIVIVAMSISWICCSIFLRFWRDYRVSEHLFITPAFQVPVERVTGGGGQNATGQAITIPRQLSLWRIVKCYCGLWVLSEVGLIQVFWVNANFLPLIQIIQLGSGYMILELITNFFPLPFPSPPLLPFPCAIFPFWFSRLSHGGVGGVEGVVNFHNNIFQRQKKNNIF